jgi:hypothetical protein
MTDVKQIARRDAALMAAIQLGAFVHLTFESGEVQQGWIHLHAGQLHTCTTERRDQCDEHRQEVAKHLYDGIMREYPPMDVEHLIRVDAAIVASGMYTALWHHPSYAGQFHTLERERLACCSE